MPDPIVRGGHLEGAIRQAMQPSGGWAVGLRGSTAAGLGVGCRGTGFYQQNLLTSLARITQEPFMSVPKD